MTVPTLAGVTFAKQFPNPAEPYRGLFVAEQVAATASRVRWSIVAPVPYVPKALARPLKRAWVKGSWKTAQGVTVVHPRYPVLPRRMLYTTVGPLIAGLAQGPFGRAVTEVGAQFVHAHALYPSASAARRLAAACGLPLVVTVHGSDLYSNLRRPAWEREIRATVEAASAVVCVSRALAIDAVTLAGADPRRTLVIPDAYDDARFIPVSRMPAEGGAIRFATVGRLVEVKGFDVLLEALALAVDRGLEATLVVIGAGHLDDALTSQACELGIADRVRFTGPLAPHGIVDELARADVYVQPSRAEGFGVALVEAMATGLPAIASDTGGPREIVVAGTGSLVEPGSVEGLADALMGAPALVHSVDPAVIAESVRSRFSRAVIAARLIRLYREVVAGVAPTGTLSAEEAQ